MKKKFLTTLLIASMIISTVAGCGKQAETDTTGTTNTEKAEENVVELNQTRSINLGDDQKPRVLITTDLEIDDQNSFIHQCLFFNEIDLAGIVVSASQFHFVGDGEHTLEEVNDHFMCANGGSATECRPMELDWLPNLWMNEYAQAYEYLSQNAEGYYTPEELVALTKIGNVEFEGDVRHDTDGSDLIKNAILDDNEKTLFILAWGGFNTTARALLSIAEEYKDTDEWNTIYDKVVNKIILCSYGQDYTYKDHIAELYPDLVMMKSNCGYAGYSGALNMQEDALHTFNGEWLYENIKANHGAMNELYRLVNDGIVYPGEEDEFQFGNTHTVFNKEYDDYDFISEGDSNFIIAFYNNGLRGMENGIYGSNSGRITYTFGDGSDAGYKSSLSNGKIMPKYVNPETGESDNKYNPYLLAFQMEWAARADWCVKGYEECNHAPEIEVLTKDFVAAANDELSIEVTVNDPDGDAVELNWYVNITSSSYSGNEDLSKWNANTENTTFTVPGDVQSGDSFCLELKAEDNHETYLTRYAQIIVTVE